MKFSKKVLLALGMLMSWSAWSDQVLIIDAQYSTVTQNVRGRLEAAGHTVTVTTNTSQVPTGTGTYQQVWDLRYSAALTSAEVTNYTQFITAGGFAYFVTENPGCCMSRNNSVAQLVTGLGGGSTQIGPGWANNVETNMNTTYMTNGLTVNFSAVAAIVNSQGIPIIGTGGTVAGMSWIGRAGALGSGVLGTIVTVADTNWLDQQRFAVGGTTAQQQNVTALDDIIRGIVAGTVAGTISSSGNGAGATNGNSGQPTTFSQVDANQVVVSDTMANGTFTGNGGTLQAATGTTGISNNMVLNSTGMTVDNNGQTLSLTGSVSGPGGWTFSNSGTGGSTSLNGTYSYTGPTVIDSGATVFNNSDITSSSLLTNLGTFTNGIAGTVGDWVNGFSGSGNTAVMNNAGTAGNGTNYSTFNNSGVVGTVNNLGTFTNTGVGQTGNVTNSGGFTNSGTTGTVTNTGTFTNNAGATTGDWTNNSTLNNSGTMGNGTNLGTFTNNSSGVTGTVSNLGTFTNSGQTNNVNNAGTFTNSGTTGTVINDASGTFANNVGGVTGPVDNNGDFTNSGTTGPVDNDGDFTNSGTTGPVTNNGTFTNQVGGHTGPVNNSATGTFSNAGTVGAITNLGAFTNSGTGGDWVNGFNGDGNTATMTNTGTMGNGTNYSTFNNNTGGAVGTVTNVGTFNNTGSTGAFSNTGELNNNAGGVVSELVYNNHVVNNAGTITLITYNGGTVVNDGTIGSINNNQGHGSFHNNGTVSGAVTTNSLFNNNATGVVVGLFTNNGPLTNSGSMGDWINNGIVVNSGTMGNGTNNDLFDNGGTVGTVINSATGSFSNSSGGSTGAVNNSGDFTNSGTVGAVTNSATGAFINNAGGVVTGLFVNDGLATNNGTVGNWVNNLNWVNNGTAGNGTNNTYLINSGTVGDVNNTGAMINSGTAGVITNTGSLLITGGTASVINSSVFEITGGTLGSYQQTVGGVTDMTFSTPIAVTNDAQLAGVLNINAAPTAYGRYTVLSAGSVSGTYGSFTSAGVNDYLKYSGDNVKLYVTPPAAATQASADAVAGNLGNAINLQASMAANGLGNDCSLFGRLGWCINANLGRSAAAGGDLDTGGLTLGRRLGDHWRVGVFTTDTLNSTTVGSIKLKSNTAHGAFLGWNKNQDGLGLGLTASWAQGSGAMEITRNGPEVGVGLVDNDAKAYQLRASYTMAVSDSVIVIPYIGVRHTEINVDGYTEKGPVFPLTVKGTSEVFTDVMAGLTVGKQLTDRLTGSFTAGVLQRSAEQNPAFSGTSEIGGMSTFSSTVPNNGSTNSVLGAGISYAVNATTRIGVNLGWQQRGSNADITSVGLSLTKGF